MVFVQCYVCSDELIKLCCSRMCWCCHGLVCMRVFKCILEMCCFGLCMCVLFGVGVYNNLCVMHRVLVCFDVVVCMYNFYVW